MYPNPSPVSRRTSKADDGLTNIQLDHARLHSVAGTPDSRSPRYLKSRTSRILLSAATILLALQFVRVLFVFTGTLGHRRTVYGGAINPAHAAYALEKCRSLETQSSRAPDFARRSRSDRFVPGTNATLITNAAIWTGGGGGHEVLKGDVLLDQGLIRRIGHVDPGLLAVYEHLNRVDAQGRWVTPGIVDMHSHLGVDASPALSGANDGNSRKGPILPWLRALDGLNTHDDAYRLSASGGVTTSLVLPGSANAIGGQGVVIKLRPPTDHSPTGMLLENPYNSSEYDSGKQFRFRQMKHACGENPDRVYSNTRMDTAWAFREGYEKARQIKEAQDGYCAKATSGQWSGLGEFPEDLQWEALVDVLRGRVKVHTHCYETVDLDDLVRISNEFQFQIAAFHHAHETYLVPDTLKSAYGTPPAAALFATHMRYKRESYRGSEFAPRILAEAGIKVVMKSDHPVLDSRFLLYEAQQAYYYGLPHNLALSAVTATPATVLGLDHRIGFLKEGYDADIVLWDSHPLALGATPQQVWIDGIAQISHSYATPKPAPFQRLPRTPNFDAEARAALEHDGLPPLGPKASLARTVVFTNASSVYLPSPDGAITEHVAAMRAPGPVSVVVRDGMILCIDAPAGACVRAATLGAPAEYVDLAGGSLAPGLTTFGSALGLEEIQGEVSTKDGYVLDALRVRVPKLAGGKGALIHAVDGLQFGTRHALVAYRAGVTTGVVAPLSGGFLAGTSTALSLAAQHKLEPGAVVQAVGAVHVAIHPSGVPSVSTQIGALRRLLLHPQEGELGVWLDKVKNGETPLVVDVESADIIATLIALKAEVEHELGTHLKLTLSGAHEAHLLAAELRAADIGVILAPARPFPKSWETRRILPGPPLTEKSAVRVLLEQGVTVGLGVRDADKALNTRFDAAWAALEAGSTISKEEAIALVSTNVQKLLGIERSPDEGEMVATLGGDLLEYSKVVGVISPGRGVVDLW
ncbi:carbohydrate esterase family 9 protein [Lenzites betulinus]|nr:carbohydrate esterase family 9 protein [Lenzites betulinus]